MSEPAAKQDSVPGAAEYKLADAISLYSQQTAAQYQLWAFYTATVLGSIVFSLAGPRTETMAWIFIPPYLLFGLGELFLMHRPWNS